MFNQFPKFGHSLTRHPVPHFSPQLEILAFKCLNAIFYESIKTKTPSSVSKSNYLKHSFDYKCFCLLFVIKDFTVSVCTDF